MKKTLAVLSLILFICFLLSGLCTSSYDVFDTSFARTVTVSTLPESLKEIREEAFENTSVEIVVLQNETEIIGERAFADIKSLRIIYIPGTIQYINSSAFDDSINMTIVSEKGSLVAEWAESHNIPFAFESNLTSLIVKLVRLLGGNAYSMQFFFIFCPELIPECVKRKKGWKKSMRPQDRPELYPINYRFP